MTQALYVRRGRKFVLSLSFYELLFLCILGEFYTQGIFQKAMILEHLGALVFHKCWCVRCSGRSCFSTFLIRQLPGWREGDIYVCAQVGREWPIGVGTSPLIKQYNPLLCRCVNFIPLVTTLLSLWLTKCQATEL